MPSFVERPWLGEDQSNPHQCGRFLRVVQRGASNVYFPIVVSSIYLPLWGEDANREVIKVLENERYWSVLSSGVEAGGKISLERCRVIAELCGVNAEELLAAAQRKFDGAPLTAADQSEEEFRRQEYEALRTGRGGSSTDLLVELAEGSDYGDFGPYIRRVGLVKAGRAAGQDDAARMQRANLLEREVIRMYLAIDLGLAHAAGDELRVLTAEIQDEDHELRP